MVQGGGIALAAAVALVSLAGLTTASAGASGPVGSGGIAVSANGTHDVSVEALNIAIGAFALGATVATATNERAVLASLSSTSAMSTTGAVLVAADSHDSATANTPGGGGGGISISVMVPVASVSGATRATLAGDITGSSSIEVRATGENVVKATAFVVGVSVIGISGAVATATLEDDADVEALVGDTAALTSSGDVLVDARHVGQGNKATATATIGSGGGIASFAVAVAVAEVENRLLARLDGDVTTSGTGLESVKVNAGGNNEAVADTFIVSGGLFSGAGAGALAELGSGSDVEARVGATSDISSQGAVVVNATSDADATASSDVVSGGLVGVGVALPKATVGGTTRAELSGDITQGDALTVTAAGTYDATATAHPLAIGFVAVAGADAEAVVESSASIEAHIGPAVGTGGSDRPTVNVGSGAVLVSADATMTADATADSIAGGAYTLSAMFPTAKVNGVTRAFVRDGTDIDAGSLDVHAGTSGDRIGYTATATTKNLAISFVGGTGAKADAKVNGTVEAFVGAPAGATPGGPVITPTMNLTGTASVTAHSAMKAEATADAGSGGAVTINVMLPTSDVAGTTAAYIGEGISVTATGLTVKADGDYDALATSWLMTISVASASAAAVAATVSGTVDAHVGSAAGTVPSSKVARLNLSGALAVDAVADMQATPTVKKALGISAVDVTVLLPVSVLKGTVRAYAGEGIDIDATSVHIKASAPLLEAKATATALGFNALGGLGIVDADATNESVVEAFVGAHRSIDATNVPSSIDTHGGFLEILVDTKLLATATANTSGFGGAIQLGVASPTARVTGYVGGYLRDGIDVTAGSLSLKVGDTGVGQRVVIAATATTRAVGVSAVIGGGVAVAEAVTGGTVEAFLGAASGRTRGGSPGAQLVISGAVDVTAASDMDATATAQGTSVGGAVAFNVLIPTAWVTGATRAFAGDGTRMRSTGLTLLADSDVRAAATTEAIAVGLGGSGNGGSAEAIVASTTEAYLGERADSVRSDQADVQIRTLGGVAGPATVRAISSSEAVARNDGIAASLVIGVNVLTPTAKLSGATRAYIGPRTNLFASTVDVTARDTVARASATVEIGTASSISLSVTDADAKVSRATEAFVGHHASLALAGNALTLTADSPQVRSVATTRGFTGGALADVSVFSVDAYIGDDTVLLPPSTFAPGADNTGSRVPRTTRSVTRAFIDSDSSVGAGAVTLDADSDAESQATIKHAGIAGFISVGVAETEAVTEHDTEAWIGDRASLTLTGLLKMTADDNLRAVPTLESFGFAGLVKVSVFTVHSNLAGAVYAGIGDGTDVSATGVTVHAGGVHSPATRVSTTGVGGLGAVTVIDASAKDASTVTARIGPAGAPASSSDLTAVTTTGTAGAVKVEATLDSTVVANSSLKSISFGLSAGFATIEANQNALVQAVVGQSARITSGSGGITVDADHDGVTYVDAASLGIAFGIAVAKVNATANHDATVKALVGASAALTTTNNGGITVNADHNDDFTPAGPGEELAGFTGAAASANNSNFALLGAVGLSETKAHATLAVETTVEAGATLNAPGGAINVTAGGLNAAVATLKSVSFALVRIDTGKATPLAEGTTTVSFLGNVGTAGTSGAASLTVKATGFTWSFGSMNASGGWRVSRRSAQCRRRGLLQSNR
jgi:hypothetical protein